ncbi:L-rhamnose mutarotase [candidate division KSB1 bacterium]|nr:L-rhamnose mutarotase [candidate division KSB1 bacterium]
MPTKFKRYCKILTLKDDPGLIAEYKKVHAMGAAWPEITQGIKDVGILDMEIYIYESLLFMIMDTVPDFDHETAIQKLATLPRQQEWEQYVSKFQQTDSVATAAKKWQLLERIFELEQNLQSTPEKGYIKELEKS